jgi:hypothetical protein
VDETNDCGVRVTDALGISADEIYFVADDGQVYLTDEAAAAADAAAAEQAQVQVSTGPIYVIGEEAPPSESAWVSSKTATAQLFAAAGLEPLGGMSGLWGWSSLSTFQRCQHLWNVRSGSRRPRADVPASEALEVGDITHVLLAIRYMRMMLPDYPLDPPGAIDYLRDALITPAHLDEAVRIFSAYEMFYGEEDYLTVLAVEHEVVDPRTGRSCRWDLVIRINRPFEGLLPGVFLVNHKTSSRDGKAVREGWRGDGQIIGEWDLYHLLRYDRRWGPARGICVNLIMRQKSPVLDRLWVMPSKSVVKDQQRATAYWTAQMAMAKSTGYYPRSRAACITRYGGLCEEYERCVGMGDGE